MTSTVIIHPFYSEVRVFFLSWTIPLWLAFSRQLYWDRDSIKNRRNLKSISRIYRISGWFGTFFLMITSIDFYSVLGVYPAAFTSVFYALSVWCAYLPLVWASYQATLSATKLLDPSNHRALEIVTKVIFFNTGPLVMLSLFIAVNSHLTATGLLNCVSGLIAYPSLLIGVHVLYILLRIHLRKMLSAQSKSFVESSPLQKVVKRWRRYAFVVSLIMFVVTMAYVARFQVTLAQAKAGLTTSRAADATAVADPSALPSLGGIVLPFAVLACLLALIWKSWRPKDKINESTNTGSVSTTGGGRTRIASTGSSTKGISVKPAPSPSNKGHYRGPSVTFSTGVPPAQSPSNASVVARDRASA